MMPLRGPMPIRGPLSHEHPHGVLEQGGTFATSDSGFRRMDEGNRPNGELVKFGAPGFPVSLDASSSRLKNAQYVLRRIAQRIMADQVGKPVHWWLSNSNRG